jgi:hypothetical protein
MQTRTSKAALPVAHPARSQPSPHAPADQHLEKTPLEEVAPEPSDLLDRTRYQRSSRCAGGWARRARTHGTAAATLLPRPRLRACLRPCSARLRAAQQIGGLAAWLYVSLASRGLALHGRSYPRFRGPPGTSAPRRRRA